MDLTNIFLNKPFECEKCGNRMLFMGVGEYKCEKCKHIDYDDYGKVRNYIEKHHGATAGEIEAAIGIKQKVIRQLLKDERIEVTPDSKSFLQCELCGCDIRSGRLCKPCRLLKEKQGKMADTKKTKMMGAILQNDLEDGAKRFTRE